MIAIKIKNNNKNVYFNKIIYVILIANKKNYSEFYKMKIKQKFVNKKILLIN